MCVFFYLNVLSVPSLLFIKNIFIYLRKHKYFTLKYIHHMLFVTWKVICK